MNARLISLLLLTSLVAPFVHGQTLPTSERVTRDWTQHPAIVSIAAPDQLYALGDVHGDYDRLAQLLVAAKIIDSVPASPSAVHWSAGRSVLVCTGDLIDKYNQSIRVIALMRALQQQAPASGGRVIVTLGNHEAEFLASHGQGKKGSEFAEELKSARISPTDIALGRDADGLGTWLRDLPAAAKVGDWFFCHAGNTNGLSLAGLDKDIQQQLTEQGWGAPILADPNSMLEARMHPRPWWDWDGNPPSLKDADRSASGSNPSKPQPPASENDSAESHRLLQNIVALGARHLVFGHQPGAITFQDGTERAAGQMYCKYDGLVFLIDTGMSRGVQNGRAAVLRIDPISQHPSATAVYIDGATQVLWP